MILSVGDPPESVKILLAHRLPVSKAIKWRRKCLLYIQASIATAHLCNELYIFNAFSKCLKALMNTLNPIELILPIDFINIIFK